MMQCVKWLLRTVPSTAECLIQSRAPLLPVELPGPSVWQAAYGGTMTWVPVTYVGNLVEFLHSSWLSLDPVLVVVRILSHFISSQLSVILTFK